MDNLLETPISRAPVVAEALALSRNKLPFTVKFVEDETPAGLLMVRLLNVVELVPPIVWGDVPIKDTVLNVTSNAALLVKLPEMSS